MEKQKNAQNSVASQLKRHLNKMLIQLNFLIRNDRTMSQLDIDILMDRTRELYDMLCSIDINEDLNEFDYLREEDFESEDSAEDNKDFIIDNFDNPDELGKDDDEVDDNVNIEDNAKFDDGIKFEDDTEVEDRVIVDNNTKTDDFIKVEDADVNDNVKSEENNEDVGFDGFENFNILTEVNLEVAADDSEMKDKLDNKNEVDNRDVPNIPNESIADKLEKQEDNSIMAKFKRKPITDLKTAIGINDKFLFLNELFNGSMEKYNKSVTALNEFKTLLGAKTYMSELQIELQWKHDSEAYSKLMDLVERRFLRV